MTTTATTAHCFACDRPDVRVNARGRFVLHGSLAGGPSSCLGSFTAPQPCRDHHLRVSDTCGTCDK